MLNDNRNKLLTIADAAEILHVSRRTLSRWARLRKGPPRIKVGRAIYYRRSSLERWLVSLEEVQ